jgi:putative transmembrane protein PGPGW
MNTPNEKPMKSRGERALAGLRRPKLRLVRIPIGVLLILGGLVGFLPLVGFWMVPLGLAVLAIDFPIADRILRRLRNLSCKLRSFYFRRNGPPCQRRDD